MDDLFYLSQNEPVFSTDIEKLRKEKDEERRAQLLRWEEDFKQTFCTTVHGRRVLWFIIHETYVFRKYRQHNASAYALEGKRELGQDIIDIIGADELLKSLIEVKNEEVVKQHKQEQQRKREKQDG